MTLRTTAMLALLMAVVGGLLVSLQLPPARTPRAPAAVGHAMPPPFVMFRSLARDAEHGRTVVLGLSPGGSRIVGPLSCTRLHYAGGRGVCAMSEPQEGVDAQAAYVFDHRLAPLVRIALDGVATRVRVAPTGDLGAITTYTSDRGANDRPVTNSIAVDLRSGAVVADLSEFQIEDAGGAPIHGPVTVSGLAFERDGRRFFATLVSDGEPRLVAGSIGERRLTVLRTGVANEALSPDGRRLVVKKLFAERGYWQLAIIDLATWMEHDLPQGPRSVDDQVEWLDNEHVMFHDDDGDTTSVWIMPADGGSGPQVLVKDAYSGAAQR